ncbi:MAG: hypothetical protein RQ842_07440 [Vulcanisaeta sp.]|nr:hypothetical protein [Vulcanisaeta sp.]
MGLGEVLFKLGTKPTPPSKQNTDQPPSGYRGDFVQQYLRCLELGPNDFARLPGALRRPISDDNIKCIGDLMRSTSWDELFTKINMELAILEAAAKHDLKALASDGNAQGGGALPIYALYSFVLGTSAIRSLITNESTREVGLATLAKAAYLLFDLLMELSKRKVIPPNLEVEFWRVREVLVDVMEKLFKGNRMMTVDGKSFDKNK